MAVISITVGIAVWIVLDNVQSRRIREIFISRLTERLGRQAMDDRLRFDSYVKSHHQSAMFFIKQEGFLNHVKSCQKAGTDDQIKYHERMPGWLPDRQLLRIFTPPRMALLLDAEGKVMEVFKRGREPLPDSLIHPGRLLIDRSTGQSYLTMIDGSPYLIASAVHKSEDGSICAVLMLVSPIDDQFLMASARGFTPGDAVALLTPGDDPTVMASSNLGEIPPGSRLSSLREKYITTGKEFFDYGASDLVIKFASFISVAKVNAVADTLISKERKERAVSAVVFIIAFSAVTFWIAHRIHRFSMRVADFSGRALGIRYDIPGGGDQIYLLEEQFHRLAEEIIRSREIIKRQAEEQTRLIVRNAFDSIISADDGISIATWNPRAEETFGWKESEAIGRNLAELIIPPRNRESFIDSLNAVASSQEVRLENMPIETVAVHRDGHEIPVELSISHTSSGEDRLFIVIIRDISERKRAEEEARMMQSRLIHANKMTALGTLVSGVVHEINNPNSFIMSNARLFQDIWQDIFRMLREHYERHGDFDVGKMRFSELEKELPRLLGSINKGAERIKNIVDRLKRFARPETAGLNERFDLNDAVRSAVMFLENSIDKYTENFRVDYGDDIPVLKGSSQQIEQVVVNLVMNALQSLDDRDRGVHLTTSYESDSGSAMITVTDEGVGMSSGIIDRITEPFFTTRGEKGGTGLGLSISYAIVKDHGGEMEFHSSPGRGTTVYVKLPLYVNNNRRSE
jgi:PAS domain S-box-containing protein